MMAARWKRWGMLAVAALFALACNLTAAPVANQSSAEATLAALAVQASVDASVQQTASAGGSGAASTPAGGEATATQGPSSTPEPSLTPTNSVPTVSVSVDTNCRTGPSNIYDYTGALLVGETTEVLGRLSNNQYVVVRNPDGGPDCWLWMQYATVSGEMSALPVMTPPPTPTPTYTPTPLNWFHGNWNVNFDGVMTTVTVVQAGNALSGTGPFGAGTLAFNGTVSGADYKLVNGTWTVTGGYTGTFQWQLLGDGNQFGGTVHQTVPAVVNWSWCGWRGGAAPPVPCAGP